ncbi:hypothetical protein D3C71_557190 [compost metagenome]
MSAIGSALASTVMRRPSSAPRRCRCGSSDCSTTRCVCAGASRAAKACASQRWPSIRLAWRRPACFAQSRCHTARRRLAAHAVVTAAFVAGSRCQPAAGARQNASRSGTGCMRCACGCASRRWRANSGVQPSTSTAVRPSAPTSTGGRWRKHAVWSQLRQPRASGSAVGASSFVRRSVTGSAGTARGVRARMRTTSSVSVNATSSRQACRARSLTST